MVKTMKIAGVSAAVLASVCSFAVLANPSQVRAEGGCNATPSVQDFSAYYYDESVNKAHVEYTGEMPLCDCATVTFSLNSYSDEGAEWETSGNQKFVDHATVVLTNEKATLAGLRREIDTWLPSVAKDDDRVLIYFAGHGFMSQGKGYLAPADFDRDRIAETRHPGHFRVDVRGYRADDPDGLGADWAEFCQLAGGTDPQPDECRQYRLDR